MRKAGYVNAFLLAVLCEAVKKPWTGNGVLDVPCGVYRGRERFGREDYW